MSATLHVEKLRSHFWQFETATIKIHGTVHKVKVSFLEDLPLNVLGEAELCPGDLPQGFK